MARARLGLITWLVVAGSPSAILAGPPAASRPLDVSPAHSSLAESNEVVRRVEAYLQPVPDDIQFEGDIVYRQVGGTRLRLDVYRPRGTARSRRRDTDKPTTELRPAVMYVHGGGWKLGTKAMGRSTLIDLARRGYVAISIDYRLVPQGCFPRCVKDCKAALRWVKAHAKEYGIDPDRIGLIGASAGAHLVALMAVSDDDDFRTPENPGVPGNVAAVVAFFGPFDLRGHGEHAGGLVNALIGGPESQNADAFRRASPLTYVSDLKARDRHWPPFLFIHGDKDELVHISQSRRMCKAICDAGGDASLIEVHGGTHGLMFGNMEPSPAQFRRSMFKFLDRALKGAAASSAPTRSPDSGRQ